MMMLSGRLSVISSRCRTIHRRLDTSILPGGVSESHIGDANPVQDSGIEDSEVDADHDVHIPPQIQLIPPQ